MKYIIALFTSSVHVESSGKVIYFDPTTKNGYLLKGNLSKQRNILPIRFVFALFSFLILYSILPVINGISTLFIFAALALIGLIAFEYHLYTKILPNCSCYPNYQLPEKKNDLTDGKRNLLLVLYSLLIVVLCVHAYMKKDLVIFVAVASLLLVAGIRFFNLLTKRK